MLDPALDPIEQMPLRLRVAERLRSAIVTGKLRPGDPLTETALAEQLNVSRAPIREAIQDLDDSGGLLESALKLYEARRFGKHSISKQELNEMLKALKAVRKG